MIITILIVVFNVFLLIYPRVVLAAAKEGLLLWFNSVLPSLLPFIVSANLLMALGFSRLMGGILAPVMGRVFRLPGAGGFALVTGLTSGYPVGAKTVADLLRKGELSTRNGQHLLAFCNNAGPLFVIGVVGVGLFNSSLVGYLLWTTHVLASLVLGVLLRGTSGDFENVNSESLSEAWLKYRTYKPHIGKALADAVRNAMDSLVFIGGLIIFFSVITAVAETALSFDNDIYNGLLAGIAEVTGGVRRISMLGQNAVTLGAAAFIVAFGGFSIHAQTFHFTAGTGIRAVPYLLAKIFHGIIAAGFTMGLWILFFGK